MTLYTICVGLFPKRDTLFFNKLQALSSMENNSHPLVSQLVPLQKNLPERKVHLSSKKLTSLEQNSKKKKQIQLSTLQ